MGHIYHLVENERGLGKMSLMWAIQACSHNNPKRSF